MTTHDSNARRTNLQFDRLKCERHRLASLSLSLFIVQKAMPAATPSLDTADSPRPLRDPSAPRIEGSSIHGFYGQDAGKSFQTDTARADPGSPHAEELEMKQR